MDIRKNILLKYMEKAATEQVAAEYQERGYEVINESKYPDIGADLIVKKDKEIIVFEIKASNWDDEKRQTFRRIRNRAVRELGAKFKLVLVNLPETPSIEIEGLESIFFDLLIEHCANELSSLSTHAWIDEISDIEIETLLIRKDEIEVNGSGLVALGLQYGSDSDFDRGDELRTSESFPFRFHVILDKGLNLKEVFSIDLDIAE